jgi:hypothetical protein
MDGRVLTELFEESFLRDHAVRISEAGGDTTDGRGESYSDRDMEIIADRLRGLGYLE